MKFLKTYKLFESPDQINWYGDEIYYWNDPDTWAFGYYNDKLYVIKENSHDKITITLDNGLFKSRDNFYHHGRIWTKEKFISFWDYPNQNELKKIINELENKIGQKIWGEGYMIELTNKKFELLEDYISSDKRTENELSKEHEISPLLKKRKVANNYWNVRYKKEKPLKYKQKLYQEKNQL